MSKLLLNERCFQVQPSLVRKFNCMHKAAVLQQMHYWMSRTENMLDDHLWVYKTYEQWSIEVGLTGTQVARAMRALEDLGYVVSCQPEGYDRRKWYRVNYAHEDFLDAQPTNSYDGTIVRNRTMEPTNSYVRTDEIARSTTITEITEITAEITSDSEILCQLLADKITGNAYSRPTVSKEWIRSMDRAIRLDGRTVDQLRGAIEWASADEFWSQNIRSPQKLREHYETLRQKALVQKKRSEPKGFAGIRDYLAEQGAEL